MVRSTVATPPGEQRRGSLASQLGLTFSKKGTVYKLLARENKRDENPYNVIVDVKFV